MAVGRAEGFTDSLPPQHFLLLCHSSKGEQGPITCFTHLYIILAFNLPFSLLPSPATANVDVLLPCLELLCTKMDTEQAIGEPLVQIEE